MDGVEPVHSLVRGRLCCWCRCCCKTAEGWGGMTTGCQMGRVERGCQRGPRAQRRNATHTCDLRETNNTILIRGAHALQFAGVYGAYTIQCTDPTPPTHPPTTRDCTYDPTPLCLGSPVSNGLAHLCSSSLSLFYFFPACSNSVTCM